MKRKRVLVLMHEDLVPPRTLEGLHELEVADIKTEYDVCAALEGIGYEVREIGIKNELKPLDAAIEDYEPHVVFNLLEEFRGNVLYDYAVVSYLELRRVPYTGCNPRRLVLARDKALAKKILHYHRINVPDFWTFPLGLRFKKPKNIEFPVIVKSLIAEGSAAIAHASVVSTMDALMERVKFVHERVRTDAIAEQFIEGRELYVGVIGNHRLKVLPTWELFLNKLPEGSPKIATARIKWDLDYQEKHQIEIGRARALPDRIERNIARVSRRVYRRLGLSGYARIDYRLTEDGKLYFLEANPNPDIASDEEFATSAEAGGLGYRDLLQKIVNLGVRGNQP